MTDIFMRASRKTQIMKLTPPQGLAIKLGITPCFIPTLLAVYLNNIALSAILRAVVYANAVSKTPGPVSVSTETSITKVSKGKKVLAMPLDGDIEERALVK